MHLGGKVHTFGCIGEASLDKVYEALVQKTG